MEKEKPFRLKDKWLFFFLDADIAWAVYSGLTTYLNVSFWVGFLPSFALFCMIWILGIRRMYRVGFERNMPKHVVGD